MTEPAVLAQCQTPKKIPTYDYQAAIDATTAQMDIMWLPTEPMVEKDLQCIRTELTESELHGVLTTLKLFTLYEQVAGSDYWSGRFREIFPRPDFERMAICFSNVELNVHAPFYQRVDELLGLNTDEFYSSFVDDPDLKARMGYLDDCINDKDDLFSVGVFSMIEGAILYTSFAFLMHFQVGGKNLLKNIYSGLKFSVRDENLHSMGGAWAFKVLLKEKQELGLLNDQEVGLLKERLREAGRQLFRHEEVINKKVFEKGRIKGITQHQMDMFSQSRVDLCLEQLIGDKIFRPKDNPIRKWFYDAITGDVSHDFFNALGSGYNRDWKEQAFRWETLEDRK